MKLYRALIGNPPLANICFALVLIFGVASYLMLPREQDPEINFNWVIVTTLMPGASAADVEKLVTNPLEDAIAGVADVRFVSSNSREDSSSILVRFREISERTFDKRVNDLRREVVNKANSELPAEARDPMVMEISTSNGFPTAILMLRGKDNDEELRRNARQIKTDLEHLAGVDTVFGTGLRDPELQVRFDPARLAARGLTPNQVADSVAVWYRDTSAGALHTTSGEWLIRLVGQSYDPEVVARIPVLGRGGQVALLGDVAEIAHARARPYQLASTAGEPAVSFAINKKSRTNTIELVERLGDYIAAKNLALAASGVTLSLADDQTVPTRSAISVMERNAWQGWLLVMLVCWLFLGSKVALLVGMGIPFSLAGTFAILYATGYTLNISVLLGSVIALGMLVDDAVVVVEAVYYRVQRGQEVWAAAIDGVREVWQPVMTSVATTAAAFLPLMLMPGIVGKFMFVIPFVVSTALAISLLEAFWILPIHVGVVGLRLDAPSRLQHWRNEFNRRLRLWYGRALAKSLRHPYASLIVVLALVAGAGAAFITEQVRVQFFAFDPLRIFYVNVDMPPSASIDATHAEVEKTEALVRGFLRPGEARSLTSMAGVKFTDTEPFRGDPYGQVIISLNARAQGGREVGEIVAAMRSAVEAMPGPARRSFLQISGGVPLTKPVSVKLRGDSYDQLRAAANAMLAIVAGVPGARDVVDDDVAGRREFNLQLDRDALARAGLDAGTVSRLLRLNVDGEVVSVLRTGGDKIDVRVKGATVPRDDVGALLQIPVALPAGGTTTLGALVHATSRESTGIIKHYNLRRAITVEADLDKTRTDTVRANDLVRQGWDKVSSRFPGIDLDFSGELEDIQESLDAMGVLFAFGVGLIYLILAAQFRSYFQPLMILSTVPLAFTGVTAGLLITGNPLSLFTMYGVIALAGIAVNSAIVLISATNDRLQAGRSINHAVVQAARRRVVPVLITSLTTIAGLSSLAMGLGGKSLLWGPVASSIVWGLAVATVLTLFVIPVIYSLAMRRSARRRVLSA